MWGGGGGEGGGAPDTKNWRLSGCDEFISVQKVIKIALNANYLC